MQNSFSIAEARSRLAALIHQVERQSRVQITRRGRPVAVLLSIAEYNRVTSQSKGFWEQYCAYLAAADLPTVQIEPELFEGIRDRSSGREVRW